MPPNINAVSVTGLGSILSEDGDSDYMSIEQEIISGASPVRVVPVDFTKEYKNELSALDSVKSKSYDFDLTKHTLPLKINEDSDSDSSDESTAAPQWTDPHAIRKTEEEQRQTYINRATADIYKSTDDADFINADDEEDEMSKILEQIDQLYTILELEGISLTSIQKPNIHTTKKEAKRILKILQMKNDKLICCSLFEEFVLAGAYALEDVFDGQREIFGKKYDLTGYSDTIKLKLRRMRYNRYICRRYYAKLQYFSCVAHLN
jgi:uncharacterized protein YlaN (UPF0358 family)